MSSHSNEAKQAYGAGRQYASMALLRRGYEVLHKAPGLANLGHIQDVLQSSPELSGCQWHEIFLSIDTTIDGFCICTAVECAVKAFLIDGKFIVHSISSRDDQKIKELRCAQKERPITQLELLSAGGIPPTELARAIELVDAKTISLSTMLRSPSYYEVAGLNANLVELLRKTSRRRNADTHYFSIWLGQAIAEIIETYVQVKYFFGSHVVSKHNELVAQAGYPDTWKIPDALEG